MSTAQQAPGCPGSKPTWTTSEKNSVGTARARISHVWFTTHRGILGEIYYPRVDLPAIRDMGMLVTAGDDYFSEEKSAVDSKVTWLKEGVPGVRIINTSTDGRYVIEKRIIADPKRHTLLQHTMFKATKGKFSDYRLYVLIAPHLGDKGEGNSAKVGAFKGLDMLMAEQGDLAMALACSAGWVNRSAGFVGVSDGWQDLNQHKRMTWHYEKAEKGNVALIGEIDLSKGGECVLALGFGKTTMEAGHRARSSLDEGFEEILPAYERQWDDWQEALRWLKSGEKANSALYRVSTAVLATHESKDFQGGTIASLSFPWGEVHGDDDQGGYHLIWPRDAYESAGALLAAGAKEEVLRALDFYQTTQDADGHWAQNMWLDGSGFWTGIQLDEAAAPILLLDLARRHKQVSTREATRFWPMVRSAIGYIVRQGPSSPQDRWEEDSGLTAYTLGAMIAALLIAAEMADENHEAKLATYLRETADAWNGAIERWTYVEGSALAKQVGVEGYYVRLAPPARLCGRTSLHQEKIKISNRDGQTEFPADEIVSADALSLVRFGLRATDDPRMVNTVRVIDAVLKVETPRGPGWHRYNHDGYGEKADGSPFEKTGVGRLWPLLTGERAHYELAAGNQKEAQRLLGVMEALAGDTGLLSEQVWDAEAIPEKRLFPGRPSGSARPLVWAHAEHIKLLRSLEDGAVFDMPPQTVGRYLEAKHPAGHCIWRFEGKICHMAAGHDLRIETRAAARVRWSVDDWKRVNDTESKDPGVGLHVTDLPTRKLPVGTRIFFTFYWLEGKRWEEENFLVVIFDHPGECGRG